MNYAGIDATSIDKKVSSAFLRAHRRSQARQYRGEVVYNQEDDQHFPTLTVGQTLKFALKNKVPRKRPNNETRASFVNSVTDVLLQMFAIQHTENTVVGDAMVRGVSGGERKRVSIAETLISRPSIAAWDGSTRGLDSSTYVLVQLVFDEADEYKCA